MDLTAFTSQLQSIAIDYGIKILGAFVLFMVGRWIIHVIINILRSALTRRAVDLTLQQYVASIITVTLNILLVIAILAQFGVQTTSFAAIIASAGLAIGLAWGGLLANFAAGAFLLILRPFKVGEMISGGGTTGRVEEIGLFTTTIMQPDGVRAFVGNNKLFGDNILNLSATPHRRVERSMQLAGGVDVDDAISRLKNVLATTPGVLESPAPEVWVVDFTMAGPVLAVRPYCKPADYWSVYSNTNDAIRRVASEAGHPAPVNAVVVRQR
ncbi:mechanosensitive ion channel family protein [soil metagenome]